jgi:hypothetical protein
MPRVEQDGLTPFFTLRDNDLSGCVVDLYCGNTVDVMKQLPERSVQAVITSPPYWGLRSYAVCVRCHKHLTAATCWACGHVNEGYVEFKRREIGAEPSSDCGTRGQAQCGACFVCSMVGVFREVYRLLRNDGVLWLNLGDSYAGSWGNQGRKETRGTQRPINGPMIQEVNDGRYQAVESGTGSKARTGLDAGNLIGVPWRVALALQADGWILRSDVPWVKRSAMPEPSDNRPNKALEYFFMFVKDMDYFFDMEAIRQPSPDYKVDRIERERVAGLNKDLGSKHGEEFDHRGILGLQHGGRQPGRNFRNGDLWFQSVEPPRGAVGVGDELVGLDVTGRGYKGAHFATYSQDLIEPLILSSTSDYGACAECGAPWQRMVIKERAESRVSGGGNCIGKQGHDVDGTGAQQESNYKQVVATTTVGWEPRCACGARSEVRPCLTLDPFVGSGTTCAVSLQLGRSSWGIDLNDKYLHDHAMIRVTQAINAPRRIRGIMERVGRAIPIGTTAPPVASVRLGR